MRQMVITRVCSKTKLSQREELIVLEIGKDKIDTATAFVDYIGGEYGVSKSSVWYHLNKLKEAGLLTFATKEEKGLKALSLTREGRLLLREMELGMRMAASQNPANAQWHTAPPYNRLLRGYQMADHA